MIFQRKPNLEEPLLPTATANVITTINVNNHVEFGLTASRSESTTSLEDQASEDYLDQCESQCERQANRKGVMLAIGAGGIYISYLYYGTLQEDVYTFHDFHYVWFVQTLEAFTNIVTALIGWKFTKAEGTAEVNSSMIDDPDPSKKLKRRYPQVLFMFCGTSLICSKALTNLSINSGLSFPLATLAKSSRMAPVMIGQLLLGNSKYSLRDYIQVMCIIVGTAMLGLSSSSSSSSSKTSSTSLGINLILLSLFMDGISGGLQKRIKEEGKAAGYTVNGFDFMLFTNVYMFSVAALVAAMNGDFFNGLDFSLEHPELLRLIFRFCIFGAAGQSFIFFTIAHFDPLVCSTVTTTRKIFSVLLSIWLNGHVLSRQGWSGIMLAFAGIMSELQHKVHLARVSEGKSQKG